MSTPGPSTLPPTNSRPRTHKPRGICRYYETPRGCFAGNSCKFLHGQEQQLDVPKDAGGTSKPLLTPYDQAKICRYYASGFCRRGDSCWFKHVREGKEKETALSGNESDDSESTQCSICYETPVTFGLLEGCNHVFCIKCIKSWRDPSAKSTDMLGSGNTKSCPMCRTSSHFITPSSIFVEHGTAEKERAIQNYKDSMARVPCRYFVKTRTSAKPMCPFGKDCFYKHEKTDGSIYVFSEGVDVSMRRYAARHAPRRRVLFGYDSDSDDDFEDFPFNLELNGLSFLDFLPSAMGGRRRANEATAGEQLGALPPAGDVRVTVESLNPPTGAADSMGAVLTAIENARRGRNEGARAYWQPQDEAQERIEILANQMLTSFTVLRNRGNPLPHPRAQSGTPPPPLEPINTGDDSDSLPSLQSVEDSDDDDDTYDGMPDLDTVSESSEDEFYSETSEDDDDEDSMQGEVDEEVQAMIRELSDALSRESFALGNERGDPPPISLEQPFLTYLESLRSRAPPAQEEDEDMPDLEVIAGSSEDEPDSDDEQSTQPPTVSSPEPPFVTDGRGRVVWTSNGSRQEQQPSTESGQPATRGDPAVVEPSADSRSPEGGSNTQRPKIAGHQSHTRSRVASGGPNGFTTDGRGRVVGAGSGSSPEESQGAHPPALGTIWSSSLSSTQGDSGQGRRLGLDEVD
ncbi:makorin-2 [Coprinopsis sp. MPI-PUGE-AT-0042]|nr:makorin-2 [Coprinopsis sp. MPI-PUGE-AT-0042]